MYRLDLDCIETTNKPWCIYIYIRIYMYQTRLHKAFVLDSSILRFWFLDSSNDIYIYMITVSFSQKLSTKVGPWLFWIEHSWWKGHFTGGGSSEGAMDRWIVIWWWWRPWNLEHEAISHHMVNGTIIYIENLMIVIWNLEHEAISIWTISANFLQFYLGDFKRTPR